MTTKILTPADLSDDFIIAPDNKVHLAESAKSTKSLKFYVGVMDSKTIISSSKSDEWKRRLTLSDNLGIIYLDFQRSVDTNSGAVGTVLTFPSDAPTPINTMETRTWDGGYVYIEAGTRTVKCKSIGANRRYVIDLIGFFE